MHPLSEGIFCWINKGHYFWYLFWHWSIGVFGKQRCFCEVTCETSCHSFSLVPQLQKCCGADERLFLDNTCFFFFHNPEWETNSSPLKRWKHCEASHWTWEAATATATVSTPQKSTHNNGMGFWSRLEHGVRTPGRLGGFARHAKNLVLTPHPEMRQNVDVWQRSPNAHHNSGRFRRVQPDDYRCGNGLLAVLTRSVPGQK